MALVLAGTTLSGCTEEKPAVVKQKADQAPDAGQDAAPAAEEPEAPETPGAQIGDTVVVGDWEVTVTDVQKDAGAAVAKANQFNDPAKGQYVLVTYEASYTGQERTSDAMWDLTWSFTGADSQVNEPASVVTVADNESWPSEARRGGTVKQQVVFDIARPQLKGGILTVEGYDAGFDEVFADFPIS